MHIHSLFPGRFNHFTDEIRLDGQFPMPSVD
jgi:hypothetical protein